MARKKKIVRVLLLSLALLASFSFAPVVARRTVEAATIGATQDFYVEPQYDLYGRSQVSATLQKITNPFYLYVDNNWWNNLSYDQRQNILDKFYNLSNEFERNIYPKLKATWGEERRPGIDNDIRVTVLVHPMRAGVGGYFRSGDEYPQTQVKNSNQREMIYISTERIEKVPLRRLYYYIAHEFTHLITFNQKDARYGVSEKTWLNEGRAEYTETLLGYDKDFSGSNLEQRVKDFLVKPTSNLLHWDNTIYDYARVNLFLHYLVEHYGINILKDSLHSPKVGLDSLNYALKKNGYSDTIADIYQNWLIANVVNDCSLGKQYCYLDPHLQNFTILPYTYYLPSSGQSSLAVTNSLFVWTASWQRIIGGKDNLKFTINIPEKTPIKKIPYIIVRDDGKKKVGFIDFRAVNEQTIYVPDFGENKTSFIFIPFLVEGNPKQRYYYSWNVSTVKEIPDSNSSSQISAEVIQSLWQQLMEIQKKINYLRQEISLLLV